MKISKGVLAVLPCLCALGLGTGMAWSSTGHSGVTRTEAEQILNKVTREVDIANTSIFNQSSAQAIIPNPVIRHEYNTDYGNGLKALRKGDYSKAVTYLKKADQTIRSIPEWKELR